MASSTTENPRMDISSILEGLKRLSLSLQDLEDRKSHTLGHYKEIPKTVQQSYDVMQQGANLVHATSTKYTLLGKLSAEEQERIAQDLLRGCQLVATGALVIFDDSYGCCRSTRFHSKRAARGVVATVIQLVEAFAEAQATGSTHTEILEKDNNIGAQKCGAVWQTCDAFINKKVPQGNRNAMRRDLFTWMMECNETMEEFQELIDRGPIKSENRGASQKKVEFTTEMSFEEFCQADDGEQYTEKEMEIAKPVVALIKCSRGSINVTLKASDCAGDIVTNLTATGENDEKRVAVLEWIGKVHDLARTAGEEMTDLGTLLYPTLAPEDIEKKGLEQAQAVSALLEFILDAEFELSEEVTEMATKIRNGLQLRRDELTKAVDATK